MTDATAEKHFETGEREPSLRLREQSFDDSPNRFVLLEERRRDGWTRVGSVELRYGPADARGICTDEVLAEWAYTEFHSSARVRVGRRLTKHFDFDTLEIVLEEQREEVLGFGECEEYDWQPVDLWRFEGPGGDSA